MYLDEDEYIYIKNNSLPNYICEYLINLFDTDAMNMVYPGLVRNGVVSDTKKTLDLKLLPSINKYDDYLFQELTSNINNYFQDKIYKYKTNIIPIINANDTGYHIQKYIANTGFYGYHNDSAHIQNTSPIQTRVLTFIWYLNTVNEGGETEFLNGRFKIKPETGKLLIFPATWTYMHQGIMPISSDKYIVTGWFNSDIW